MREKKNNGVIVLLIVIIAILLILCTLFATGKISFSKNKHIDINSDNNMKKEIDTALLNNLYDIIGIGWDLDAVEGIEKYSTANCLNYYLSDNDYKKNLNEYGSNAQRIFALYIGHIGGNTAFNKRNSSSCDEQCQRQLSCSDCNSVLKTTGDRVKKLYDLDDFQLTELAGFNTDYVYLSGGTQYIGICHYDIAHNLSSRYIDNDVIEIVDRQVVTDYDSEKDDEVLSTKHQDVTYTFKKDLDKNYYLSSVVVK